MRATIAVNLSSIYTPTKIMTLAMHGTLQVVHALIGAHALHICPKIGEASAHWLSLRGRRQLPGSPPAVCAQATATGPLPTSALALVFGFKACVPLDMPHVHSPGAPFALVVTRGVRSLAPL